MSTKITVTGMSPVPPALKSDGRRLMCSLCGSGFQPNLRAGVFVKELRSLQGDLFLTFCDSCAGLIAEPDLRLLVAADCGTDIRLLEQKMKEATALRKGYVLSFGKQ